MDGSKWDWSNWTQRTLSGRQGARQRTHNTDPKQPDNQGGNEFCLQAWGPMKAYAWGNAWYGTWNDLSCNNLIGYVCQKKV
jgi:hypothetical protein